MARILVVDDVKFISRMLGDLLGAHGHEIVLAADGVEALETAIDQEPDLVLLDITLPRLDGLEVARVLKGDPATSRIPILVITARRDPETMKEAIAAGVDDFLTKPFDNQILIARVASLLGETPPEEEIAGAESEGGEAVPELADPVAGGEGAAGEREPSAPDPVQVVVAEDAVSLAQDLRRALEASERRAGQPVVIDLSGTAEVGPDIADTILTLHREAEQAGRRIDVIRPAADDLRTRLAVARIARETPVHADREAALAAARSTEDAEPGVD
jgi:CheY-like chemotaxis protein